MLSKILANMIHIIVCIIEIQFSVVLLFYSLNVALLAVLQKGETKIFHPLVSAHSPQMAAMARAEPI